MGLVYPSFMSRSEIAAATADPAWPRDPDGAPIYPGLDRDLDPDEAARLIATGAPFAFRLKTDEAIRIAGPLSFVEEGEGPSGETGIVVADPTVWGDVILARKETPTSYHLAVVVDDALQGVTHVVRGRDLFHATAVHVTPASAPRPADAGLSPPSPDHGCARAKAVQIRARHQPQGASRSRRDAGGHTADGRDRAG